METIGLEQDGDFVEDLSGEKLLSLNCLDVCDIFPAPKVLPRVGDLYQVDVPALIPGTNYVHCMQRPTNKVNKDSIYYNFWNGFLIPAMFNKDTENMKDEKQEFSSEFTDVFKTNVPPMYESTLDTTIQYQDLLFSGSSGHFWSDIEKESFLLGLYIFEKNFAQLNRFVETKKMGDILSFYYGVFYRSTEYNQWSKCRKQRSRKHVHGEKIFSGLRQHELLSRLLPQVPEECQKAILEISKTFGEGKLSLKEFVFALKAMVGMNILVEAIGIGKGKQDLTHMETELAKNQVTCTWPDISTGKAWSALTPTEILTFLSSEYRLSKARANDLFWEAIWPRLLARGWHSEQPKRQTYVPGEKLSLVFLIPGVDKFSERRLEKGLHYFNSVTDVLNKVSTEPWLLELETDVNDRNHTENGWTSETGEEAEYMPESQRHCYLQPRTKTSSCADGTKFAVVDTSLAHGKRFKFKEIKTLPAYISGKKSFSKDTDTSEISANELDSVHTMLTDKEETNYREITFDENDMDIKSSHRGVRISCSDSRKPVKKAKKHKILFKDMETVRNEEIQLRQKRKRNEMGRFTSVTKRCGALSSCTHDKMSTRQKNSQLNPLFEEEVPSLYSDDPHLSVAVFELGLSKRSTCMSNGSTPYDDYHGQENMVIALNSPQLQLNNENGVMMTDLTNTEDDITSKQCDDPNGPKLTVDMSSSGQHDSVNSRRQSTRNRPTARALEALVNGYLTTNRRQTGEDNAHQASRSRPPSKTRFEVEWSVMLH